jgi:hypothetical protein
VAGLTKTCFLQNKENKMNKMVGLIIGLVLVVASSSYADVWGVNPSAAGNELVNLDPFTGAIAQSFGLPSIAAGNTEIGLAGWSDELFYTNANTANGTIYVINPTNGSVTGSYAVSGGWEMDGLGYFADAGGSYIYTSGCSAEDVHRYNAVNGAGPQFYWSNLYDPRAVAGDNGGRIFSYAQNGYGGAWGIYEINPVASAPATLFAASPSTSIVGMAYDGTYLYLSDTQGMLYTMNNSGALVNSLNLGYTLYALGSTEGVPVPLPGAVLLGMLGLSAAGLKLRRLT